MSDMPARLRGAAGVNAERRLWRSESEIIMLMDCAERQARCDLEQR